MRAVVLACVLALAWGSPPKDLCRNVGTNHVILPHEKCNKFYTCSANNVVVLTCPRGLLYNAATEACDYPANVVCSEKVPDGESGGNNSSEESNDIGNNSSDNSEEGNDSSDAVGGGNWDPSEAAAICAADDSDSILVANENCNKFYKCSHGFPIAITCQSGLLYNPDKEWCDWPENVNCGDRIIPEGGDNNSNGNGEGDNDNGGGNSDPSEAPAICAADDSDSILVANENCNQFYICSQGVPVALNCPNGLLYNPSSESCDWPENVNCGDRIIPEGDSGEGGENGGNGNGENGNNSNSGENNGGGNGSGDNENNSNSGENNGGGNGSGDNENNSNSGENIGGGNGSGDNENNNNGGGNSDPSEAPAICAADDSDGILVANENCNKFYKCSHGFPIAITCQSGLLYNPDKEWCDWPENVNCGDRIIPEGGDGDGGDNNSNGNGEGDNDNGGGNSDPSEAPAICAADDSDSILVANENCNQFYICSQGVPVALNCPNGLLYNPSSESCDWPENVNCGDRIIPEGDSGEGGENGGNGNVESGNNSNSGENNSGGNGSGDNENNSNSGENIGGENGSGDNENNNDGGGNSDPSEAPAICAADDSDGILVANENCNKFYKCSHGFPIAITCQSGLLYNPDKEWCDWPENVNCGDRIIPEGGDGDGGDNNSNGNGEGDNDNGGGNSDPSEAPAICAADDSDSILVANENCNQFYICSQGVPVALNCPNGLLYNPSSESCDWPENVNCGDRIIPEGDSGEGGENGGNGNGESGNNSNSGENNSGGNGSGDNENNSNSGENIGGENGSGDNENNNDGGGNSDPSEAPAICAADDSDGILVANENCNKFYKCSHGFPIAITCQSGLLYNPDKEWCDWPENVNCGDRIIPEGGDGDAGDNNSNGNGEGDNDNGGGNSDPSEAPAICAADDSDSILVANENCNQFYICSQGVPVALNCPNGLLYNPSSESCDWPENVNCGDRIIPEGDSGEGGENGGNGNGESGNNSNSGENNSGGNGSGDNENNSNSGENIGGENGSGDNENNNNGGGNSDPSEAPAICAADDSDGILVANENCNKFYKCSHGFPIAITCQSGLLYNPDKEWCDWPENVNCGDRIIPEGGDGDGGDNNSNGNGEGDNDNGGGNSDPSEAPAICAADDSDSILVANENCNQFYICSQGVPVALNCPNGLLYNPSSESCDWPENVNCGDRIIPEGDSGEGGENGGNGNGESGNNSNSGENNSGGNGSGDNENNSNSGENIGGENGSGDNENNNSGGGNSDPSEAPAICAADDSDGILVANENCNKFYKCSHGFPIAITCQSGLLYNSDKEWCDWPENVNCGDRIIPEGGDGDGGDNNSNGNGEGDNDNSGGNSDPSEAPAICAADDSDSVLVAHENCNEFYICTQGVPVTLRCPKGLLYNPGKEACDWPENVNCSARISSQVFYSVNKHLRRSQFLYRNL